MYTLKNNQLEYFTPRTVEHINAVIKIQKIINVLRANNFAISYEYNSYTDYHYVITNNFILDERYGQLPTVFSRWLEKEVAILAVKPKLTRLS